MVDKKDEFDEDYDSYTSEEGIDEDAEFAKMDAAEELDELSKEFVKVLIDKIMEFMQLLVGHDLHPYQKPFAK